MRNSTEELHDGPRRRVGPLAALGGRLPGTHDLLLMQCPGSLRPLAGGELPDWARAVLRAHPWVTVGRAPAVVGTPVDLPHPQRCTRDPEAAPELWFPVTVRGPRPGQRLDALAPWAAVARTLRPEQLAGRRERLAPERLTRIPALALLPEVGRLVADHRMPWGPIGAAGYELGSGVPVAGPLSPLRLGLRAPQPAGPARPAAGQPPRRAATAPGPEQAARAGAGRTGDQARLGPADGVRGRAAHPHPADTVRPPGGPRPVVPVA